MTNLTEWLTTYDAAKIAGFHPDHIRRLIRSKELEAHKWGNSWMIHRDALSKYLAHTQAKGKKRGPKEY
jgi:excisionase family DNA binding protein